MNQYLTPSSLSRFVIALFLIITSIWGFNNIFDLNPRGVADVLKWSVFIICGYHVWAFWRSRELFWAWSFVVITILYNPFLPIRFQRSDWMIIDHVIGLFLIISILLQQIKESNNKTAGAKSLLGKASMHLDEVEDLCGEIAFCEVRNVVEDMLKTHPQLFLEMANAHKNNENPPRISVFVLTLNVAGELLSSGEYHAWRGVLDYRGKSIKRVYCKILEELIKSQIISQESADGLKRDLNVNVHNTG